MIRNAYLAPSEFPVCSLDVKKALLTFDKLFLADPADRELIPPQSFMMAAFNMPPIMGGDMGPVRPLGKIGGYDHAFDQLMDELDIARREGCVEVVSTYDLTTSKNITIGAVLMGDYPLHPSFMFWAYRNVAKESSVLRAAIEGDRELLALADEDFEMLGLSEASADGSINDIPALPMLDGPLSKNHLRMPLTLIARARIASTMKSIGYCASKELVPLFGRGNFDNLVGEFSSRAMRAIDRVADEDPYWAGRRKVLDVAHEEYIDESVLSSMSIEDVLRLRTKVWGHQAEARDALLKTAAMLARDAVADDEFESAIREDLQAYRELAEDVERQRANLRFNINCELTKGALGVGTPIVGGVAADGMLTQMQTAVGAATVVLAGCMWAIDKIQNWKPAADELRAAEREFSDNACFGLHNFYIRAASAVGSNVNS